MAAVILAVFVVSTPDRGHARPTTALPPYTTTGLGAEQRALIRRGLELFRQAGLPLPPIDFVGHATRASCFGSTGAQTYADHRSTIHLCAVDVGRVGEALVLHELAHAWDHRALTSARRRAFLRLRGLREWRNDDPARWHERGAEHAAEIIVWGVIDWPIRPVFIPHHSCAELLAGYFVLTGRRPLHGYTDQC